MKERHALPLLLTGLGFAAGAGLGLAFGIGPPFLLAGFAAVGVVLVLAAQHRLFRLPDEERGALLRSVSRHRLLLAR